MLITSKAQIINHINHVIDILAIASADGFRYYGCIMRKLITKTVIAPIPYEPFSGTCAVLVGGLCIMQGPFRAYFHPYTQYRTALAGSPPRLHQVRSRAHTDSNR